MKLPITISLAMEAIMKTSVLTRLPIRIFALLSLASFLFSPIVPATAQSADSNWNPMFRPIQPPFPVEGFPAAPLPPNTYSPYVNDPFRQHYPATDLELRRNIRTRFLHDTVLHPFGIHLEVRDAVATLTGTVDTRQDRDRAELDAYAAGAVAVDNQLQVKAG